MQFIISIQQFKWLEINTQNNNGFAMLRGFSTNTAAFDGIKRERRGQFTHNTNPEEYEEIETITGLSGFLYGSIFLLVEL